MDPRTSAQHVIHCDLCKTVNVQMHCDICLVNLCKACVGEHISIDESKDHKVVKYELRNSTFLYPECAFHGKERCEMFCRNCDISVCGSCLSSDQHISHKLSKILEVLDEKKEKINKYKSELNENVNPRYLEMESDIQNKIRELEKEYEQLLTSITKQGETLQREINKLVNQLKNQVDEMKRSQLQTLQKILDEINKKTIDIRDEINELDIAKDSNDFSKIISLQASIVQHKNFPKIPSLSAPNFTPKVIQEDELCTHFGNFSSIPLKSKKFGNVLKTTKEISLKSRSPPLVKQISVKVSPPHKKLRNEPEIFDKPIYHNGMLRNVSCLSNEQIWACDESCTMPLYSISQGFIKSIKTRTINRSPTDIAVTIGGELVYTDQWERTINIVKSETKEEVIRLEKWKPLGVCSTSASDLLVAMESNDKQSKVVRYSDSTEKQSIQFDDKEKPLYSSDGSHKFICENRNLDICVADCGAKAVVVVNQSGELKFKYSGQAPLPKSRAFNPRGITRDSQSHILTTDYDNNCVHIIDENGKFLRYLHFPFYALGGLCTNTDDTLFLVARKHIFSSSSSLEKIKYLH